MTDSKPFTVAELISQLKEIDQDRIVIMSKDSEGNYSSPLWAVEDKIIYVKNTHWGGEAYREEITDEMKKAGFTEEDDLYHGDDGQKAIVLWPTN